MATASFVPTKSPLGADPLLRGYLEREFQSVSRALRSLEGAVAGSAVYVRDFGAAGDGLTNDTDALQAALDSGAELVIGEPGAIYLVTHAATFVVVATNYRRCLAVPAGVTFLGMGATIKLDDAQNSSPVALLADGAALLDWTIDSNRDNQTSPATGEIAGVLGYDADRLVVERVTLTNNRNYAARFLLCPNLYTRQLRCTDSYGDGLSFGTTPNLECEQLDVEAEAIDCEGVYGTLEGNGIICAASGKIRVAAYDCAGGNKFQNTSDDLDVEADFHGDDQTFGTANSGNKLQGFDAGGLYLARIKARLRSSNAYGNGLFINDIDSVELESYFGYQNGSGAGAAGSDQNDADIRLDNGRGHLQVGLMHIEQPGAAGVRRTGAGSMTFDSITIVNPTGNAFQDASSGELFGRVLKVQDTAGTPTTTYAFNATSSVKGRIESLVTNLLHDTAQARVTIAAGNYGMKFGTIRLGSTDQLEGVVQLTNAATTTVVACGHVWRHFVGGASDYLHPIIQVQPWDASARALSGQWGAIVTDGGSGTGFTIQHPTAGASDFVYWKYAGAHVVSQAQS